MRAHRLTMSSMARAHACMFPYQMSTDVQPRPPFRATRVGSVTHWEQGAYLGATLMPLDESDEGILADGRAIFNGPLKSWLDARAPWQHAEVGLCYDAAADSCETGPRRGEPGYDVVGATQLRGTLDLVRITEPTHGEVWDTKTGKPPTDSEQLYAQAVAASRRWGLKTVQVGYIRALKTKVEELAVEVLDADRLDEEAGRIARVLRRLPMAQPVVNDKCDWCEARGACPEYGAQRAAATEAELERAGFFA